MGSERPLHWRNWGRNVEADVSHFHTPSSVSEVQAIVRRARSEGAKVRVVGDAHSWSPLSQVNDHLISLRKLNRVLAVSTGPPTITVEPGVTVGATLAAYRRHGVVLPTNVDVPTITIGGAVSVGANGFSRRWGTYSDFVEEVELVDGTGEVRRVSRRNEADLMDAVACSLGLFGVITKITLSLVPMFNVAVVNTKVDMRAAIDDVANAFRRAEHVQYFWFPYNDRLVLQVSGPTDAPPTWGRRHEAVKWVKGWANNLGAYTASRALRAAPRLTPTFTALAFRSLPEDDFVMPQAANVLLTKAIDRMTPCRNCSMTFPPGADFSRVRQAWWAGVELLDELRAQGRFPANLEMNMRLIGPGRALLCSAPPVGPEDDGTACNIQITSWDNPHWAELRDRLMAAWMTIPGSRPHWAKEFQDLPAMPEHLRSVYGEHLDRFRAQLKGSGFDPDGVFVNDFLRELLFAP